MRAHQYAVYILTNRKRTVLYTGITNDLPRRLAQHRAGAGSRFTRKYGAIHLVWFELYEDARHAIEREKQLKAGSRARKLALIGGMNPEWRDLGEGCSTSLRGP